MTQASPASFEIWARSSAGNFESQGFETLAVSREHQTLRYYERESLTFACGRLSKFAMIVRYLGVAGSNTKRDHSSLACSSLLVSFL